MIYFDQPFLTVRWDADLPGVLMEWKSFAQGEGYRKGLDAGLALLQEKGAKKWLADLRFFGSVLPEDQRWSNEDWFPRALATSLKYMAIVDPQVIFAKWSVERIMQKVESPTLVTQYFCTVSQAKVWLKIND